MYRGPSLWPAGRDRQGDPRDPDPGQPDQHLCDQLHVRHLEPHRADGLSGSADRRDRHLQLRLRQPRQQRPRQRRLETFYASNITYDKFGQRLSMTNGNGVVTAYTYRPDNRRLLNVQATLPIGYTFNNFNFTYDKVGNLLTLQNTARCP